MYLKAIIWKFYGDNHWRSLWVCQFGFYGLYQRYVYYWQLFSLLIIASAFDIEHKMRYFSRVFCLRLGIKIIGEINMKKLKQIIKSRFKKASAGHCFAF